MRIRQGLNILLHKLIIRSVIFGYRKWDKRLLHNILRPFVVERILHALIFDDGTNEQCNVLVHFKLRSQNIYIVRSPIWSILIERLANRPVVTNGDSTCGINTLRVANMVGNTIVKG